MRENGNGYQRKVAGSERKFTLLITGDNHVKIKPSGGTDPNSKILHEEHQSFIILVFGKTVKR